ncbi:hypothetical protein B0H13DRAFT_2301381 [Mycena leptocephala]|nr:hypothetical protein B0H13DRAFT_2301381 [Mycena leptocephala]
MQLRPAGPQLPSIRTLHPYLPAIGPGPSTSTSTYEPADIDSEPGSGSVPSLIVCGSDGDERAVMGENELPKKKRRRQVLSCTEKYVPCTEHDALCARVDALEVWTKQVFADQPLLPRVTASPAHTHAQALGGGDEGGGSAVQWGEGFRSFPAAGASSAVGAGGASNAGTSPTHAFGITITSGGGATIIGCRDFISHVITVATRVAFPQSWWMANKKTLADARERRHPPDTNSQPGTHSLPETRPEFSPLSSTGSKAPLEFPSSPTPMEPSSSEDELPSIIVLPVRTTRSTKRKLAVDSETSDVDVPAAPPAKKKPGPKAKAKNTSDVENTGEDSDPKPVRRKTGPKPKKKAKTPKAVKTKEAANLEDEDEAVPVPSPKIIFMIPAAVTDGSQRVPMKPTISFEDALELIHETIGCASVERKPTLAYKFSTAKQNATKISLCTDTDWEGLVTDALAKMKTKKDISVEVFVLPENYMLSLRAKNNKKKTPMATKGKGGKAKFTIMDLDNNDSEDGEDDDDGDVGAAEKKALSELETEYRKCVRCGPTVMCKIDRTGNHVALTFPQRRAWAVSLACGTVKVTKSTPPQSELFSMFHGKAKAPSPPPVPSAPYPYYPPMPPHGYGFPSFPGYPQMPIAPPAPTHHAVMSSDPPDDTGGYPSVIGFIDSLITKVPQRASLRDAGEMLDSLHYFDINEIVKLTVEELGTDKFGNVLEGDAQYLLTQAKREVKRLDKEARRARA